MGLSKKSIILPIIPILTFIDRVEEPWVKCHIMVPSEYLGAIMNLGMEKRGTCIKTETMDASGLLLTYRFPFNEIITDFNDKLKSITTRLWLFRL